ncbi:putative ATPase [Mycobacterium sp. JS623]|uniref:BTAD domain-containing putative transcriptional regulator n=1 Tax=Mycobacterium sp. JS623 TaxID=212767 RepID=UPI0002A58F2E|nr:BTAD domain-containing putative transcriptional regulator [Mycobacterium sp. JS623]AGB23747.1 putative ATPase [Mycobacterium sp. JS623]
MELGVLGTLQVRQYGLPVAIPGAKPRAILTMLGLHGGGVVSADTLVELLWGDDPPRTAAKALQTHISSLRRTLGDGCVLTEGAGWVLNTTETDATRYKLAARLGRDAVAAGDPSQAIARFDEALALWRGIPELPDGPRGVSEKTRWIEGHAALVEDRADALLATGRAAEIIGELEAAVADAPLRERRWGQLMLALYRAGRQGEALGAYQRARSLLADELGVDPGPELRRLEAAIITQDAALEVPASQQLSAVTRAVTFLLTDIEGSTAAWEADADAMAAALARHDEIVEQVVTSRGGRLIKTRGEGDATFSVFDRPSAAAGAAIELQEAIFHEPWVLAEPMRIRVALHTGEVELRDGDYFGRAVNRAARLRSLAAGGQILCSGATAELVIDSLRDDVVLADLGTRQLKNLARPEHVYELRLDASDESRAPATDTPIERPALPAVLAGPGPFVGRDSELEQLVSIWQATLAAGTRAVMIAGEPGVGKTRLAGEWSRHAYDGGAVVLYGRCDEDLGAPYQPFAEALRALAPCLGANRIRGLRGVEALLPLVPALSELLPDLAAPPHADADTERYALFDAVVALLGVASDIAPVVLVLDDLHWAAKPTLLLLRHLLRFGEHARVQIVGTYRSTDLDRSHPLAAMLADLHRDGSDNRLQLRGLGEDDVSAYVAEAGYDDQELARALATVTGGNPFFLIEALRHVDESGGRWDPSTLPQGVREAISRRLSRLPEETNKALAAAAVVGSRFALDLVERVVGNDLVDAFDGASKAGIVIEESGGRYRFNHAIVRQSLLAELASVRRMRLHQRIAATLEAESGAEDERLAELAYHYFECAWAGNAPKAVEYCRRAAEQAMARLAYEGAADLYDRALHALEELDDELPDRADQQAELLVARCEALLAAGDVASAAGAVSQLQEAAGDSARLAAWGTCFDGQLSMLTHPERLDEVESALAVAAEELAILDDAAGEAKAHTVRAGCLARLGRIGDCEMALDHALTAARRARDHRRVNAVLAGAPLAALWGPNPVPRAGGRCLDVVRLLRITTGSAVVEATSTRCQGVLDAFRGRPEAGRRLIDSARRALNDLGMRHALLEVEQFAGIVELVADEPASAETHLRQAYDGFRRMRLDADTAETAALLARACLALDRDADADELCTESERLAGHALKASMTWRMVRAQLLARNGAHDAARQVAEEAVAIAAGTDALVDHGDACLALATVLDIVGDLAGAQAAAAQAAELYERKGAAALADKARRLLSGRDVPALAPTLDTPAVKLDNLCVRVMHELESAFEREDWDECEKTYAPDVFVESRRKVVGFTQTDLRPGDWPRVARHLREGWAWQRWTIIAVRGERLALTRLDLGTDDASPGAPHEEMLVLCGLDEDGRIALQVMFDVDDIDAAMAELDAAHARFEAQSSRAPLENAASRGIDRYTALFASGQWDEIGTLLADNVRIEDRRQGLRGETNGRAGAVAEARALAALGVDRITSTPVALRGDCLCLAYGRVEASDDLADAFHFEALMIVELDSDGLFVSRTNFDPEDIDTAIAELDARYLTGEAAPYPGVWQSVMDTLGEANRHELGPIMGGLTYVDHRRVSFGSNDFGRAVEELWALVPDARYRVTAIHALDAHGTVASLVIEGTDTRGNELQWPRIVALVPDEQRMEVYDEDDLDAALAMFEQLSRPAPRLENTASQVTDRFLERFAAGDWEAMAQMVINDISFDDRRRVVNADLQIGRDLFIDNLRAAADLGATQTANAIATRGDRVILARARFSRGDGSADEFGLDFLNIVEVDAEERIAATVTFDLDDIDAAFEELETRYIAGEAAAHAHTWSLITEQAAALNRREIRPPPTDFVNIDHRRVIAFPPGDLVPYVRATWNQIPDLSFHIEAVHRLSDLGAVCTLVLKGTSQEGVAAEWRIVEIVTVQGNLVNRTEIFDETDLDAGLARFGELDRPAQRLENAASRVANRLRACFEARDWDAISEILARDISTDDRRRIVGAGIRKGRDAEIASLRAAADVGTNKASATVVATRGERLALIRACFSGGDQDPWSFHAEVIAVVETTEDIRIARVAIFEPDDFDAAFAELEARYRAGEGVAHAHTWLVVVGAHAALNRQELPPTTPDWVNIDHRRATALRTGDLFAYIRSAWDLMPDIHGYIEVAHQLNSLGAVVTHVITGTSKEGVAAMWRQINVLTVDGDRFNRIELFDESDLDAALARFDELGRPPRRLENTAAQSTARMQANFMARDWAALTGMLADDYYVDDRRHVVSDVLRQGRDVALASMRAMADVGVESTTVDVIATRGARLVLIRTRWSGHDHRSDDFHTEVLAIVEVEANNRMAACVMFDRDDFDAAFEELDARYIAGEAAAHAHTWSVIADHHDLFNRRELPPNTPELLDHRPLVTVEAGDPTAEIRAMWNFTPDLKLFIEAVHRLSDVGAVFTQVSHGSSQRGFDAEWRVVELVTVDDDAVDHAELFDESDLESALARFDELSQTLPRPENAASRVCAQFRAAFANRDWSAMAEMLSGDLYNEDRRAVVNAGIRHGQDSMIEDLRAAVEIGVTYLSATEIATRGERLVLVRGDAIYDERPGAFRTDLLQIAEIDANDRIAALVMFDPDDIDAAFEELETRYLAGEAAAHTHTWSVITRAYAVLNRHEMYPATADLVSIDHRRGAMAFPPGDLIEYIHASWNQIPDLTFHIEAVHRLSNLGAVYTQVLKGSSQEGFAAEWRIVEIVATEGERISHAEIFDEVDLDAAIARFEELQRGAQRLENTASHVYDRCNAYFAARDWDAMGAVFADDVSTDDRRRVVGGTVRQGREAVKDTTRAIADFGMTNLRSTVIATRGSRLILARAHFTGPEEGPGAFRTDILAVVEINADERIATHIVFDPDDIDAAFAELEKRYLAGEAAAHARVWSVVAEAYAALNRHQLPATTPAWQNVDRRLLAMIEAGGLTASIRAGWELSKDSGIYIETVHRLSTPGAVVTWAAHGISHEGFEIEQRGIGLMTVDGDLISRCDLFDETELDSALARFEELRRPSPRSNTASQVCERFRASFAARDWDAMTDSLTDNLYNEDRRRVVNAGVRHGRHSAIEDLRAAAEFGVAYLTAVDIASRGERLILVRGDAHYGERRGAFYTDVLQIAEIDADERIAALVMFDPDDLDAAFEELDARYLAGEAATHAHTWALIARTWVALNRHEVHATTPDWVHVDRRPLPMYEMSELPAYLRATWDLTPQSTTYIETVHRLTDLGAVLTNASQGTSNEGFEVEWRYVCVVTFEADLINRAEVFEEADLDDALVRFDELDLPATRLENAASRADDRFFSYFAARDWDSMADAMSQGMICDDRRRIVNAGIRRGRDAEITNMREIAETGITNVTPTVVATRGERLVLTRARYSGRDQSAGVFRAELLDLVETNAENLIVACVLFEPDDIDAAFEELDARYLAGEAAPHTCTWSLIAQGYAAINRGEVPSITGQFIDRRRLAPVDGVDLKAYIAATLDLTPDITVYIEAVHRLTDRGAVVTHVAKATSQDGADTEWRVVDVYSIESDRIDRCEMFDDIDIEAALASFEKLNSPAPLENAATRTWTQLADTFNRRDVDDFQSLITEDCHAEDRRKGLRASFERLAPRDAAQAMFDATPSWRSEADLVAIRGAHFALMRNRFRDTAEPDVPIAAEYLTVVEVSDDGLLRHSVRFDPEDINGAIAELTARWIASGEVAHPQVIKAHLRILQELNRHDWDAHNASLAGATYVNHRQLGTGETVTDFATSVTAVVSLIPNVWVEPSEILRYSASGVVGDLVAKGTSLDGVEIEIPMVLLSFFEGNRLTHFELFDADQREQALARFTQLKGA